MTCAAIGEGSQDGRELGLDRSSAPKTTAPWGQSARKKDARGQERKARRKADPGERQQICFSEPRTPTKRGNYRASIRRAATRVIRPITRKVSQTESANRYGKILLRDRSSGLAFRWPDPAAAAHRRVERSRSALKRSRRAGLRSLRPAGKQSSRARRWCGGIGFRSGGKENTGCQVRAARRRGSTHARDRDSGRAAGHVIESEGGRS